MSKKKSEICECGHHTNDHSYNLEPLDNNLYCDICDCKNFKSEEELK